MPVAKASPINPVPGGGALKISEVGGNGSIEGGNKDSQPTQRARATGKTTYIALCIQCRYRPILFLSVCSFVP